MPKVICNYCGIDEAEYFMACAECAEHLGIDLRPPCSLCKAKFKRTDTGDHLNIRGGYAGQCTEFDIIKTNHIGVIQ